MEFVDEAGTPTALAVAFANIPNQGDAWTVVVNALDRELEDASFASEETPEEETGTPYSLSLVETIGKRTAELHRALASDPDDPAFAPEPVGSDDLKTWSTTLRERADHVLSLLARITPELDEHAAPFVQELLEKRDALQARLERLVPKGARSLKTRLHGDYHLGQVLVAQNDVFIVDFEGEPAKDLEERRAKAPPARDIASMLRSLDYAANMAIDRQRQKGLGQPGDIEAWAYAWRDQASRIFLEAYAAVLVEAGERELDVSAQELLPFFLADKLLYEIGYEALNRPPWLWVPVKAALELIAETDQDN
jgi:maltose alpha-D-glucosyltransferase/alpha-amylase